MAILRHHSNRIEGRRRTENRAYIVRVGDLIEDQDRPVIIFMGVENIGQPDILQRGYFRHNALMRRILRNKARQIGSFAKLEGNPLRHVDMRQGFTCSPDFQDSTLRVFKRGDDGMASPEFGVATCLGGAAAALAFM